jgi:hypothetical protein
MTLSGETCAVGENRRPEKKPPGSSIRTPAAGMTSSPLRGFSLLRDAVVPVGDTIDFSCPLEIMKKL